MGTDWGTMVACSSWDWGTMVACMHAGVFVAPGKVETVLSGCPGVQSVLVQ